MKVLGKDFNVLRPFKIPEKNDIEMFDETRHLATYSQFKEAFIRTRRIVT